MKWTLTVTSTSLMMWMIRVQKTSRSWRRHWMKISRRRSWKSQAADKSWIWCRLSRMIGHWLATTWLGSRNRRRSRKKRSNWGSGSWNRWGKAWSQGWDRGKLMGVIREGYRMKVDLARNSVTLYWLTKHVYKLWLSESKALPLKGFRLVNGQLKLIGTTKVKWPI